MAEEIFVGSTGIGLGWLVLLGLIGAGLAGLSLVFSPKHRQELWYDDRHERRTRERAKALFSDTDES